MDVIGGRTPHVFCRSIGNGGSGDPSIHTALGVFHGIRASLAHASGRTSSPGGRSSSRDRLRRREARAACSSTRAPWCSSATSTRIARARPAAPSIPADGALELECDVYAPCAFGATLNAESIPRLRCRVVAGAANNQLATPEDGERLRARGILYAPDYVINSGGALHGIGLERLGWTPDELEAQGRAGSATR